MKRISKKYKIYLLCLIILLIIGIGFAIYSSNQEKKNTEQKQNIEKYVNSIIEAEENINDKLNSISNSSLTTIGDSDYIVEQIKNISNNSILLYNYQYDNTEYLNEYIESQTQYSTYQEFYNFLDNKYDLNKPKNYNKVADKLINSVESKSEE